VAAFDRYGGRRTRLALVSTPRYRSEALPTGVSESRGFLAADKTGGGGHIVVIMKMPGTIRVGSTWDRDVRGFDPARSPFAD